MFCRLNFLKNQCRATKKLLCVNSIFSKVLHLKLKASILFRWRFRKHFHENCHVEHLQKLLQLVRVTRYRLSKILLTKSILNGFCFKGNLLRKSLACTILCFSYQIVSNVVVYSGRLISIYKFLGK